MSLCSLGEIGGMFWEFVQGFGALVGLATGAFVLWEQLTKNMPTALIVAAPLGGFGQRSAYLRVTNRSDRPILVRLRGGSSPNHFTVAADDSINGMAATMVDGVTTLALDGKQPIDLPLLNPSGFDEIDPDSQIVLVLHWTFAQPILFKVDRRIPISIKKSSYDQLIEGTSRAFGRV